MENIYLAIVLCPLAAALLAGLFGFTKAAFFEAPAAAQAAPQVKF